MLPITQIHRMRQRLNLKQKHLASLLNITESTISNYETGKYLPSLDQALKLEIVLGVPLRSLFPHIYRQLQEELRTNASGDYTIKNLPLPLLNEDCPFESALELPDPTRETLQEVRDHVTRLVKKLTPLWPGK